MSMQDRTSEFHAHVTQLSRRIKRPQSTKPYRDDVKRPRTEFSRQAAEVGRNISDTMGKLERLAQLAQKKSLFDDRPVEVAELTYVIKQDLSSLNSKISSLSQLIRSPPLDFPEPTPNAKEHTKNVVLLLQSSLSTATLSFKEVLELRTRNIQQGRQRTEQFVSGVQTSAGASISRSASPLYPSSTAGTTTHSASLSRRHVPPTTGNNTLTLDPPDLNNPYSTPNQSQSQLLLHAEDTSASYISSRSEAIDTIERTINELGGIFSQLAEMVASQGEMIQRIDEDVEVAGVHVEGAQAELMKFWKRASNNRMLYIKMFGVLMIFFLLWVLVGG